MNEDKIEYEFIGSSGSKILALLYIASQADLFKIPFDESIESKTNLTLPALETKKITPDSISTMEDLYSETPCLGNRKDNSTRKLLKYYIIQAN